MPNWVTNKVKFKSRGKEIIDKIISTDNDEEYVDFNKIIPRPKTLNITSGGNDRYAMQYALLKMSVSKFKKTIKRLEEIPTSFYGNYFAKIYNHKRYTLAELEEVAKEFKKKIKDKDPLDEVDYKELGVKNLKDLGNIYINNILQYGADSWYDWCCENWGTKWNATNTYIVDDTEIEFSTAWSCPVNIFKELSRQFSGVEIVVEFADEDIGSNCGKITFLNGEIEEYIDMDGDTDFALEVCGYDKEEYYAIINEE